MTKRWMGYGAWLLLSACLYFFENNTGTRAVLLCVVLLPLVPPLRTAFFSPDQPKKDEIPEAMTVRTFTRREPEDSGEIRRYVPGDPVRRIHWKLSAKKEELLVRETAAGQVIAEQGNGIDSLAGNDAGHAVSAAKDLSAPCCNCRNHTPANIKAHGNSRPKKRSRQIAAMLAAGIILCGMLLLLIPEARRSAQGLLNRIFTASEAVNSYRYARFAVPENQSVLPAAILLLCAFVFLLGIMAVLGSRLMALGILAACMLFQVYFGLAFPSWINILLCALFAGWILRRPVRRKDLAVCSAFMLLVILLTVIFLPGVNADTEAASEKVRDRLTQMAEQIMGTVSESPAGEAETRHIHIRSMENGDREAETEQEFRLVTVEEEQISMPHWINWVKMLLLLLLSVLVIALPFTPFLLLNARKRKAREIRKAFASEDISEGIRAIFRQIILWLETVHPGAENLLFREWAGVLPEDLPEGYADRFARCAADYEEAAYSNHPMPERKRREAMDLLKETETALWNHSNRRQRFYLKYWMCLHE